MTKPPCSVEGCGTAAYAKGWCRRHYCRANRHGDPLAGQGSPGAALQFLKDLVANPPGNCVPWPFGKQSGGYGAVEIDGRKVTASRASLELYAGPPDDPKADAAHEPGLCHSRDCVNPLHLRWASRRENCADRHQDGTHFRGERNPVARLTENAVRMIRADPRPAPAIAQELGVHPATIHYVRRGDTWSHVS